MNPSIYNSQPPANHWGPFHYSNSISLAVYRRLFIINSLQIRLFFHEFTLVHGFSQIFSIKIVSRMKRNLNWLILQYQQCQLTYGHLLHPIDQAVFWPVNSSTSANDSPLNLATSSLVKRPSANIFSAFSILSLWTASSLISSIALHI